MGVPTVYWYYDAATNVTSGTRIYPNQPVGTGTSWTSNYTIYNSGGTLASNCYFYVDDVSGEQVSDENVGYSIGTVASYTATTNSSVSIEDLDSNGQSNQSSLTINEYVYVETDDPVGIKEWSKNISYQYS